MASARRVDLLGELIPQSALSGLVRLPVVVEYSKPSKDDICDVAASPSGGDEQRIHQT